MFGVSVSIDKIEKYVLAKQNHYLKTILKITPICQSQLKFPSQPNFQLHFVCEIGKVGFDYNHMQEESRNHIHLIYLILYTIFFFEEICLSFSFSIIYPISPVLNKSLFISVCEQFN